MKYIFSLLLFGSNGIIASYIPLGSHEIVFLRTGLGGAMLALLFILSRPKLNIGKDKRQTLFLVISGIATGISWIFLFEAYDLIGVSIATLAYYCGPVIIMLLSPLVFKERLTRVKLISFAVILGGMVLLNMDAFAEGRFSPGLLYGIASAFMYAAMIVFNKKAAGISGLENAMWQLVISFLTVSVYLLIRQDATFAITQQSIVPIFVLGLVNTGVGCYFYFSSLQKIPASSVAICGYLDPLFAVILSVAILPEVLAPVQIAGAACILGGAVFGDYLSRR